jgi:multidrug efflux pump subunit AcrA (membrane-fusion protein)
MKGKVWIVILLLLLAGVGGGWWYFTSHPEAGSQLLADLGLEMGGPPRDVIAASGIIEAQEVSITAEIGGRITNLLVDEGDQVEEGDLLIELDTALLAAQIKQAQAALRLAQANLAKVEAGAKKEDIRHAEALLEQAIAAREGAYQACLDAQALRDDPQELSLQIEAASHALAAAEEQVAQARANLEAARTKEDFLARAYNELKEGFDITIPIPGGGTIEKYIQASPAIINQTLREWNLSSQETWIAWSALYQALAARDGAERKLEILMEMRDNPLAAQAQVDAALAQYEMAQADVAAAQAQLDALRAGPTEHQVNMARAHLQEAEANLKALEVQLEKMSLKAPRAGLILERMVSEGEIAAPGSPLLRLADLATVTLMVYVPEPQIGRVKVGQEAQVEVDSYPGQTFAGRVVFIASEAEFTPQNVQTKEQRATLVFGVKIEIPNPDHRLKPGMPADARIKVG